MTTLFSVLAEKMGDYTLIFTVSKKNNKMTVSIYPKLTGKTEDVTKAQNMLIPLVITGKPEELDQLLLNSLAPGLEAVNGLISNIEEFKKVAEKAKKDRSPKEPLKGNQKEESSDDDDDDDESKEETTQNDAGKGKSEEEPEWSKDTLVVPQEKKSEPAGAMTLDQLRSGEQEEPVEIKPAEEKPTETITEDW